MKAEEKKISPQELAEADEAFLTNSLVEIMPLVAIDERPIGGGVPGPVTQKLMRLYKDLVASELNF